MEKESGLALFGVAPVNWQRAAVLFSTYHVANGKHRDEEHGTDVERFVLFAKAAMKMHAKLPN
jgi:hypothetical protein